MNVTRPEQRLRFKDKGEDWKKSNVEYWTNISTAYSITNGDATVLYDVAAGKLDESLYTYVTNPLNEERANLKGYPSKMRNIDIISSNIWMLMGELSERFFNPIVVALNSNYSSEKEKLEFDLRLKQLQQQFVNGLVQEGVLPEEIAQTPMPEDILKLTVSNLKDQLAILGQVAIDVIMQDNEVDRIRRKTFYDFIVLARCFTYKDVSMNDVRYMYISPMELSFTSSPNVDFVEDCEAVKRTVSMPISQMMDLFGDDKEFQKFLPELEQKSGLVGYQSLYSGGTNNTLSGIFGNNSVNQIEGVQLEHVQWDSMRLLKKITGIDVTGNPYSEVFDEDYIAIEGEEVEEFWVKEIWEGYRVDNNHIFGVEPLANQRGTYDNPNRVKKSYNGRIFNNNYVIPQSIVEKGLIFQIKYNIVHYQLEMTLNKNMHKITFFPLGIIPKKEGWDEFTFLYYAKATGFGFVDETNPATAAALQYMKAIDLSLGQYIKEMYDILRMIKEDWDESVGISRQRRGKSMASDGKAVTEEAIFRSSVTSEEFFKQHEEIIVRDLNGLLDLSKVAWITGRKGSYINSEYKRVDYVLDPEVYPYSEHQVYVQNSAKAAKQVAMMQNQIGTIAQQTQQFSILPRIAQAVNMPQLIEQLEAIEANLAKNAKAQQEAEQAVEQANIESLEKDRQLRIYEIDENNEAKREVALIQAQTSLLAIDTTDEGAVDAIKLEELSNKRMEAFEKLRIEREKIQEAKADRISNEKLTRENMVNDKEVAQINARNRGKK